MRWTSKLARAFVGSAAVLALAAAAWAQDYTATTAPTGTLLLSRPGSATQLHLDSNSVHSARVDLPFEFPYYGQVITTGAVMDKGFFLPNATTAVANQGSNGNFPTSSALDGMIAPAWDDMQVGTASGNGDVYTWITGTAPNRKFVISWDTVRSPNGSSTGTCQIQMSETSGVIVFAYSSVFASGWTMTVGLDSPGDSRFTAPQGNSVQNFPLNDWTFTPHATAYSGTLLYDKVVSDVTGIGNSVLANQPLAGVRIELHRDGGLLVNSATTATNGSFTINALAVASTSSGTLEVVSRTTACNAKTSNSASNARWTASSSISYANATNVGSLTLGASADSTGARRAAFNAALVCQRVRDWTAGRTTDAIAQVDAVLDPTSNAATSYSRGGNVVTVGSAAGADDDFWDDAVIGKTYARHVLASIAPPQTTTLDYRFDAVTDPQNAFAEAFGCYLWSVVAGTSQIVDGKSATTATVYNLESPTLTSPKGQDVAGWVAAALYDLTDAANETTDAVDGRLAPERPFTVVDGMTLPPTAQLFAQAWIDAGNDGPSIVRTFIGDGCTADDASEPNDSRAEAAALGTIGLRRAGLVLNRYNEDWFTVTLPAAVSSLVLDATYDRTQSATVAFELRDAGGGLLVTGSPLGSLGPVHAATGPLAAGVYVVDVKHVSGPAIPTYLVQAFEPMTMNLTPFIDWTVGQNYDRALDVAGGVPPYSYSTPSSALPPGLGVNAQAKHVVGVPTTAGIYSVSLQCRDDGNPANTLIASQTVVIHDAVKIPLPAFVGFPAAKSIDATLPTTGGTPPLLFATSGAPPSGLAFDAASFRVTGTAAPGSAPISLDAVDVAGSADHVATRAVVAIALAAKNTPADLAAGTDATGWWFDAVKGSTIFFNVATAKGRAKPTLAGTLLAPDRSVVAGGVVKSKLGGVSATKFIAPLSGRYYFVASATDGDATQLLGTLKLAPPKSGKGALVGFDPSGTTTIEVGALPGATLVLRFNGDKKQQLVAKVLSATNPQGAAVPTGAFVKTSALGGTLTMPLPLGGTWTIRLGATSSTGAAGKLTYSYSVKQPKGVTYSAD